VSLSAVFAKKRSRAVTLTELLVVLAIIGLLATIAIPGLLTHMARAKVLAAFSDCKAIADAEEQCAVVHGFYVPFAMLNDVMTPLNSSGNIISPAPNPYFYDDLDNTNQALNREVFLIDPDVRPESQLPQANQYILDQFRATVVNFNKRIHDMFFGWQGPFINFKHVWMGQEFKAPNNQALGDIGLVARDWPLDPWGNPYRFYSTLGIIGNAAYYDTRDPQYANYLDFPTFGDGRLTQRGNYRFDRYAVVSFGPDGAEGARFDINGIQLSGLLSIRDLRNDDIIYLFGRIPNETAYRIF